MFLTFANKNKNKDKHKQNHALVHVHDPTDDGGVAEWRGGGGFKSKNTLSRTGSPSLTHGSKDDGMLPWYIRWHVYEMKWGASEIAFYGESMLVQAGDLPVVATLVSVDALVAGGISPCDAKNHFAQQKGRKLLEKAQKMYMCPNSLAYVPYGKIPILTPISESTKRDVVNEVMMLPLLSVETGKQAKAAVRNAILSENVEHLSRNSGKAEWKNAFKSYTKYQEEMAAVAAEPVK